MSNVKFKQIKDYTLEDALEEYDDDFFCICGDGKIKYITNDEDDLI